MNEATQETMTAAIKAKSDQLNADDLIAGSIIIEITKTICGNKDQPVIMQYKGGEGRPYKPCKGMCRIIAEAWGGKPSNYTGKKLELYRDPAVKWAGIEVGGIRIKSMSHIKSALIFPLTASKGVKKMFTVQPLKETNDAPVSTPQAATPSVFESPFLRDTYVDTVIGAYKKAVRLDELEDTATIYKPTLLKMQTSKPDRAAFDKIIAAYTARKDELNIPV